MSSRTGYTAGSGGQGASFFRDDSDHQQYNNKLDIFLLHDDAGGRVNHDSVNMGVSIAKGLKSQGAQVQNEETYHWHCLSPHPRNSCGYLSAILDYFFYIPNVCFVRSFLGWMPSSNIEKDDDKEAKHSPMFNKKELGVEISKHIRPPCLANWFMLRSFITFTWLSWNDSNVADLKENIKSAQQNLALISALILNIVSAFLRQGDSGGSSIVAGDKLYTFFFFHSTVLSLCSTLTSVMFILQINELANSNEAKIYAERMGHLLNAPMATLILCGISCGLGTVCWLLAMYSIDVLFWMLSPIIPLVVLALTLPYIFGVQSLWVAIESSKEISNNEAAMKKSSSNSSSSGLKHLHFDYGSIHGKLDEYVKLMQGFENCNPEGFVDFLEHIWDENNGYSYSIPLSYITKEMARECFTTAAKDYIAASRAQFQAAQQGERSA
jgi:hypothetical protein